MISLVVKADQPELFNIVRTLYHGYIEAGDEIALDTPPPTWEQIEKFDLADSFWEMVKNTFGYADEDANLKKLLIRLFTTDYAHSLKADLPAAFTNLVLPPSGQANSIVCLAQWRDSSSKGSSYDRLSGEVAGFIPLDDHLDNVEINDLTDVMTFLEVEKIIASGLRDRVRGTTDTMNADDVRSIAARRQAGHWASPNVVGAAEIPRKALSCDLRCPGGSGGFLRIAEPISSRVRFRHGIGDLPRLRGPDFIFSMSLYGHFSEAADQPEKMGWDILKPLREDVESCYLNWYIPKLALAWGKFLEPTTGTSLLGKWKIDEVWNQQEFYDRHVRPRLEEAENRKAYVIISDAFRYEAAQELARNSMASIASRHNSIPAWRVAVLHGLGHGEPASPQEACYKPNGQVLVDDSPTDSTEQRDAILQRRRRHGVQGRRTDGQEEGGGPGVRRRGRRSCTSITTGGCHR